MRSSFEKLLNGYRNFQAKYAAGNQSAMRLLADHGQKPEVMVVACSDSRVDPALILQCDPGDLFVVRNVASIIPPYEKDGHYHGTSAALEFGICFLNVKHLIILGHSQCGGIQALMGQTDTSKTDFIEKWVSILKAKHQTGSTVEDSVKQSLHTSYENCRSFPWIKERIQDNRLNIHRWFFEIKTGEIFEFNSTQQQYIPLGSDATPPLAIPAII